MLFRSREAHQFMLECRGKEIQDLTLQQIEDYEKDTELLKIKGVYLGDNR